MPDSPTPMAGPEPTPTPRKQGTVTQWLGEAKAGSKEHWNKIWERLLPDFLRLARFVIGNDRLVVRTTPEDLVSEMYVRAAAASWERTLENSAHLRRRMATAFRCLLLDMGRKSKNESKAMRKHAETRTEPNQLDQTEILAMHEFMQRLENLDERQWSIFERHEMDGIPLREIARIEGKPESTIRLEYHRMLERVRALGRDAAPPRRRARGKPDPGSPA